MITLRDIARRAAILVRWHSREDYPFTELSERDREAMDRDAESLADALQRVGHYAEGWASDARLLAAGTRGALTTVIRTTNVVGRSATMSSLYEQWKPSVGDRVRIVLRDEEGPVVASGQTGTIVAVHPDHPEALCEVEYDAKPGASGAQQRERHPAAELEPIEATATRVSRQQRVPQPRTDDAGTDWQPTVGDWVIVADSGRRAVITAIDQRGNGTVCEVEYDHRPGETADPQRGNHALSDLRPEREPSAEVLQGNSRPR